MNEETKSLDISAIVPAVNDIPGASTLFGEIGPPSRPALPSVAVAAPATTSPRRKKLTTLHLNSRTCRWPIGDPVQPDFHYCGDLPLSGRNYCEKHDAMSVQPAARRRAPATSA